MLLLLSEVKLVVAASGPLIVLFGERSRANAPNRSDSFETMPPESRHL